MRGDCFLLRGAHKLQLFALLALTHDRVMEIQVEHSFGHISGRERPRDPLVVGRQDNARSKRSAEAVDCPLGGLLMLREELPLRDVLAGVLVVLGRVPQAFLEPLLLLPLGEVEVEAADHDAIVVPVVLEISNIFEPPREDALCGQAAREVLLLEILAMNGDGRQLLEVRPVEALDVAPVGQLADIAPHKVAEQLFRRRRLKARYARPVNVDVAEQVLEESALAGRIAAVGRNQHRVLPLGKLHVLQLGNSCRPFEEHRLGFPVVLKTRHIGGVIVGKPYRALTRDDKRTLGCLGHRVPPWLYCERSGLSIEIFTSFVKACQK